MNKISILFALCALSATMNAQNVPLISWPSTSESDTALLNNETENRYRLVSPFSTDTDCEPFDRQTNWEEVAGVSLAIGHSSHSWVYAERSDVNKTIDWIYAPHCPCGCPQTETEARICSVCYREEQRTRTWGYKPILRGESEYMKIKNRKQ